MTGWWLTYPSEKWWSESQLGWLFHSQLNGKIFQPCSSHHQPVVNIVSQLQHMMMMIWAVHSLQIPSGKHTKSYWKWQFIVDFPINSMLIFHSYVSLPEGMRGHSKWLVGGWPTPLKNDGVKVSWDDYSIPNWMEKYFSHVPVTTNQLWI